MNRLGWVVALLLAIPAAPALAQTKMPETQFRDYVIARTTAKRADLKIEITGPLSFKVNESAVNVGSGYSEYLNTPDHLSAVADKWSQIIIGTTSDAGMPEKSDLEKRLVHVARNKAYLDMLKKEARGPGDAFVWRPIAGDMVAVLMVDGETTIATVTSGLLAKVGIATDEAWRLAGRNSETRLGQLQIGSVGANGPVAISAASGLATGLLADENACASGPLADGAVVLVLDRDTFTIGRPEDPQSIGSFWAYTQAARGKQQLASKTPMACKDGKWTVVQGLR